MVFKTTFNNISAISWRSVLLVEKIGLPGENHRPAASHWQLYRIILYRIHLAWAVFELTTLVMIGTSNYHTITIDHDGPYKFVIWILINFIYCVQRSIYFLSVNYSGCLIILYVELFSMKLVPSIIILIAWWKSNEIRQ